MAKLKKINVKGAGDDHRVALWEKDEAHDGGEIFIANDGRTFSVAETKQVKRLIAEGRLVVSEEEPVSRGTRNQTPALRKATDEEEDRAGLRGRTERETAVVREPRRVT
jgi:hypothetical protein